MISTEWREPLTLSFGPQAHGLTLSVFLPWATAENFSPDREKMKRGRGTGERGDDGNTQANTKGNTVMSEPESMG